MLHSPSFRAATRLAAALLCLASLTTCASEDTPTSTARLLYAAYSQQNVGSMPANIVLSSDGRFAFTTDIGYRQALHSIRTSDGVSVSHLDYPNRRAAGATGGEAATRSAANSEKTNGLYYGLAVQGNTLYAAQGANDSILVLDILPDGTLVQRPALATRKADFPAGLAVDSHGHLFVANQASDQHTENPFTSTGSVAIYDPATRRELGRYSFTNSYSGTSNFPLAITAKSDGTRAYIASERDNAVYVLDATDPSHPTLAQTIAVGAHPSAVVLTRDEKRLYVANANSDTLTVIDTAAGKVLDTILLRPPTARELAGCTPTSIALSADQATAYVTLADMNAIAVVNLASGTVSGYLPTGWYPTSVAVTPDGQRLLVTAAKGSLPHVPNVKVTTGGRIGESPLNIYEGVVQVVPIPRDLASSTVTVLTNARLDRIIANDANPLQHLSRQAGVITHVLYIIKENRTYDQVLGDLPTGNGAPALCLFPRRNTPNQHALAERFVLLDNLYACGEVSGDGWCWSTQSMANAYVGRNIPYHYSLRGRKFDFEGQNNGYPTGGAPAVDDDDQPVATAPFFRNGIPPIPDVAESAGGHIWDLCTRQGVSFRNYGFFQYISDDISGVPGGPDNYPTAKGLQPAGHNLAGLTDIDYRRFDLDYPDSDAPSILARETGDARFLFPLQAYGKAHSPSRFSEWNREFHEMLARDPSGNSVPNLMFLRIPTDHTVGARSGSHGPQAYLADNDYAIGQIVQAVSESPIWPHCAIFIIEDDAQSGADHVDAHRTTGFVVSPFIKQSAVDHHFYNTNSFLRTIELLLNLPPMTQFDATAKPILDWTGQPENVKPYAALMPDREFFATRNPARTPSGSSGAAALRPDSLKTVPDHKMVDPALATCIEDLAAASDAMDFAHADAAPAEELNMIVWKLVKGIHSAPPQAPGAAGESR